MNLGTIVLADKPVVEVSEVVHVGTVDGQELLVEKWFNGEYVAWIGNQDITLTQTEYEEIKRLALM